MKIKQLSVSLLLPACLALAPLTALAEGVDGGSAGLDTITGTAVDPLVCVSVTTTATSNRVCAATCSAEANNPLGANGAMDYELAVTSGAVQIGGSERDFEFVNDPDFDADINVIEVSTTAAFELPASVTRSICCSANKESVTDVNMNINDSSMSIVCDETELDAIPDLPNVP